MKKAISMGLICLFLVPSLVFAGELKVGDKASDWLFKNADKINPVVSGSFSRHFRVAGNPARQREAFPSPQTDAVAHCGDRGDNFC